MGLNSKRLSQRYLPSCDCRSWAVAALQKQSLCLLAAVAYFSVDRHDVVRENSQLQDALVTNNSEALWDGANMEAEELLRTILAGVSLSTGEAFCRLLTQHLCAALKTDYACIGELDAKNPQMVQMVSIFAGDRFWQEYEHQL